jgi:hypothetical protein
MYGDFLDEWRPAVPYKASPVNVEFFVTRHTVV